MNTHFKYQSAYQEMQFQPELLESLEKGSIPLLHIENHQFRDRIKSAELSKKGNIYLQHYLPAKQRAKYSQNQFQSGHLKEDEFNPNLPHKNHSFWLKVRQIPKEGPPIRLGLGKRTENERIMERVQKGDIYKIDHTAKDTQMIHHPDWKPVQKQNWVGNKNFDTTSCHYQGPRSNPPWQEFPLRINHEGNEYVDGYEKVGENIHRFREKSKEHGKPDFISQVQQDAIGQKLHISQSLRTFKSHKVLGVDQNSQEFSKSKKLTFYKQPLIDTKSVDHQVPYQHSQSIRSKPVRDLMPSTDKIYKLSIKELTISSSKHKLDMSQKMMNESLKNDFTPTYNNNNNYMMERVKSSKQEQQLRDIVKGVDSVKSNNMYNNDPRLSNINSRGSQRTTQYSWNKSRAQTAASGKRKNMSEAIQLKNKLNNDPYYQPSTQETKDLVSKYFD
ncbi:hypothetical protein TTHERM_00449080 (macronuclear) [Tetrahymena thermophila SB210]|uniref:Uncharacterized protein n=1 Tax=Tetrahymena thermophila (strain SB210) TaxID=312017 RepID=Q239A7_TETTS|nr:hypothetical protein TTHERM_00449080 [Tetrahymena thermophila SB210]EAR93063.2 hypothetical protein TTHERM_00449080 [Tetrahymena thermophila SB210]|eukprot:XP_001013308.2 hypothetical protein TTHERM_00449080 [Tetrahymena thermophila SB210]